MLDYAKEGRIIKESLLITSKDVQMYGDEGIERWIKNADISATSQARNLGIKRFNICRRHDIYVTNAYSEYPMYLLGPNAPQINSWKDALCHKNTAEYTIIIRDQDYLDEMEEKWLNRCAGEMFDLIYKLGEITGREEWQKTGNWALNVMKKVSKRMEEIYG